MIIVSAIKSIAKAGKLFSERGRTLALYPTASGGSEAADWSPS
jgi:hypothetical protein